MLDAAQKRVDRVEKNYENGIITERERYNQLLDIWSHCNEELTKAWSRRSSTTGATRWARRPTSRRARASKYLNPVYLMADSGARGNITQMKQLAGMRGLMAKPSGEIIETPIRANFREGLNILEYFSSTHGARKGLADTALKTADSGYLTRKLCDIAQSVIIGETTAARAAASSSGRSTRASRSTCRWRPDHGPRQRERDRQPGDRRGDRRANSMISARPRRRSRSWASTASWSAAR
jgi:DNA-directed RNA polymerase beta' subunit